MASFFSKLVVVLVGAIPATIIGMFAIFPGLAGLGLMFDGLISANIVSVIGGIFFIGWSFLAIWGVYGLWAIVLGPVPFDIYTAMSLVGGIVAMVLALFWPALSFGSKVPGLPRDLSTWWVLFGPIVVALWQLLGFRGWKKDAT